jgi:2-polyprenyl-6-methoxyphenol hydroxylase-like FAD-dependent oxidoreductase
MKSGEKVAIVIGAGIGGLVAARALEQSGFTARVFERAPRPQESGTGLGLTSNAFLALRCVGLEDPVLAVSQRIHSFDIKDATGRKIYSVPWNAVDARLGAPSVCVYRPDLCAALLPHAGEVTWGAACAAIRQDQHGVTAIFEDGREVRGDVLIGADGFNSVVRRAILGPTPSRPSGYVAWLATTEPSRRIVPEGQITHYWGRGARFGIVDVGRGRIYWWGTLNAPDIDERLKTVSKAEVLATFRGFADPIAELVETTEDSRILKIRTRDRAPVRSWGEGRITLLGDAAHPMLTSLGQGACMAIEDAAVLGRCLGEGGEIIDALRRYETLRIPRTSAVVRATRFTSWYEQLSNRAACRVRNTMCRAVPTAILARQAESMLRFSPSMGQRRSDLLAANPAVVA